MRDTLKNVGETKLCAILAHSILQAHTHTHARTHTHKHTCTYALSISPHLYIDWAYIYMCMCISLCTNIRTCGYKGGPLEGLSH